MLLNCYSIYDEKALSYGVPFLCATDGLSARLFSDLVSDPNSTVNKHPSDFKLYRIGEFNQESAVLTPITPVYLATGADYVTYKGSAEITE